jgi:hypothetical protein
MRCNRCGGIMVHEKFYGICEHFWGWRCLTCGEIVDQVILENRPEVYTDTRSPQVQSEA